MFWYFFIKSFITQQCVAVFFKLKYFFLEGGGRFIRLRNLMEVTRTGEHRKSQDLLGPPPSHGTLQLLIGLSCRRVFLRPPSCWVGLLGMKPPQSSLLPVLLEATLTNARLGWEFLLPSVLSNLSVAKRHFIHINIIYMLSIKPCLFGYTYVRQVNTENAELSQDPTLQSHNHFLTQHLATRDPQSVIYLPTLL